MVVAREFYLEGRDLIEQSLLESGFPFYDVHEIAVRATENLEEAISSNFIEFCENNRYITSEESDYEGPMSLAMTPYLREPMECMVDEVHEYVIMQKPAQIGWTSIVVNSHAFYTIAVDPTRAIYLFPTDYLAGRWAKLKFTPMMNAHEIIQNRIKYRGAKSESVGDSSNLLLKKFPGGSLVAIGSNSSSKLSDVPASVLIVEEPDRCKSNVRNEGPSIDLAIERTKAAENRKIIIGGSPTTKGFSAIARYMLSTDQRRYHLPCPMNNCSHTGELKWPMVTWDKKAGRNHHLYGDNIIESARFQCPGCRKTYPDEAKNELVANGKGRWVATAEDTGAAGFYLNELISPFKSSRLAALVGKWISARTEELKGKHEAMITFTNLTLGLEYEQKIGSQIDRNALEARRTNFKGVIPDDVGAIVVAADVQGDRLEAEILGFGRQERTYGLQYIVIDGSIDSPEAMASLDTIMTSELTKADGTMILPFALGIDSGSYTSKVYDFVVSRRGKYRVVAFKGETGEGRQYAVNMGRSKRRRVDLWLVGTDQIKDDIAGAFAIDEPGSPGYCAISHLYPVNWEAMMRAERRVKKIKRGREIYTWEQIADRRNEALDARVYGMALRHAFRREIDALLGEDKRRRVVKKTVKAKPPALPRQRFINRDSGSWMGGYRR